MPIFMRLMYLAVFRRMQRRVAVSDGRSDIQRLIDIDGEPVVAGQFLITTSYQGQVTAT